MKMIEINKAVSVSDAIIVIRNTSYTEVENDKTWAIFKDDARELFAILVSNLPSGTYGELVFLVKEYQQRQG